MMACTIIHLAMTRSQELHRGLVVDPEERGS